jgi:hypothetical protein
MTLSDIAAALPALVPTTVSAWAVMLLWLGMWLGAICVLLGLRRESYLCRVTPDQLRFRRPPALRLGALLVAASIFIAPLMVACDLRQIPGRPLTYHWDGVFCLALLWWPGGALFLWCAGPRDVTLDLAGRTYQRVWGWPLLPRTLCGPWEDLWGVYVSESRGGPPFSVGLRWSKRRGAVKLGRFEKRAAAEQLAQEMQARLGLPRVMAPPPSRNCPQEAPPASGG